jgi:hypothetical protein
MWAVSPRRRSVYGLVSGAIPAESPSHADAQWHDDSPYSLTVAGAAPELTFVVFTGFPFHPSAEGRRTPERALSLPAIGVTVNAGAPPLSLDRDETRLHHARRQVLDCIAIQLNGK